jgi:hypothetical protein
MLTLTDIKARIEPSPDDVCLVKRDRKTCCNA